MPRTTEEFIAEYTAPRHVVSEGWAYGYEFDVDIDFSPDGKATAKISGLRIDHTQAYVSLVLTAEVIKVIKRDDMVRAVVKIESIGRGRSVSMPLATSRDPSTWTWGDVGDEFNDSFREMLFFPYDKYPDLEKIESFEVGSPIQFTAVDQTQEEITASEPQDSLEIESRTYLKKIEGMVRIKKAGGSWSKAEVGMDLEIGDMVKTLSNGKATAILKNTAIIKVKPGSEFFIPKDIENTKQKIGFIELMKGFLWARAKRDKNSLKIVTPNAICGVRGTEFEVGFKDGITCVDVAEGIVWLKDKSGSDEVVVKAGESACFPKGADIGDLDPQE